MACSGKRPPGDAPKPSRARTGPTEMLIRNTTLTVLRLGNPGQSYVLEKCTVCFSRAGTVNCSLCLLIVGVKQTSFLLSESKHYHMHPQSPFIPSNSFHSFSTSTYPPLSSSCVFIKSRKLKQQQQKYPLAPSN